MTYQPLKIALLLATAAPAVATTVSINFPGNAGSSGSLVASDVAGVAPVSNWNNVTGSSSALVDSTGAASTVTVSFSSGGWSNSFISGATADQRMMKGYLDITGTPVTVTLGGLDPASTYQVYVYSDGDGSSSDLVNPRVGSFTLGGVTTGISDPAGVQFSNTYTAVPAGTTATGNYTVFTISGSASYALVAKGTAGGTDGLLRSPLNGLQIVQVPETASALLGLLGLAPLLRRRR